MKEAFLQVIDQAIDARVASSISLWVGGPRASLTIHRGHSSKNLPTDDTTLYDLASLTKILATLPAMARAIALAKISLNEEPFKVWPGITVLSLLSHSSGLAAHVKFYEALGISERDFLGNQKIIYEELFRQKPIHKCGEKWVYSDLNFLALGFLLEERFKKSLGQIFRETWQDLGWTPFSYLLSGQENYKPEIAPTEQKLGEVNDRNCFYLGGIAAHAGLFGTLQEVSACAQFFNACYRDPQGEIQTIISHFTRRHIGFHKANIRGSTAAFSAATFGHFGFSGTSLWVDPWSNHRQGLMVILLTNRVHRSLKPEGIYWLRKRVHSLAARLMGNG